MGGWMSAMEDVPYEWIFAGQVREIQAAFPEAHKALVQWGIWSRQRGGIFPTISSPSLWDLAKPGDPSDWVEPPAEVERVEQTEVKAEAANDEPCDEKTAEASDVLIHDQDFPTVWRRCLAAAYVTREVPEHLFPREASRTPPHEPKRISHDTFLLMLDGALRFMQGKVVGSDGDN
jgi:hypothetical protein